MTIDESINQTLLGGLWNHSYGMMKERPRVIPTVYLVLVRGNKLLLSRRYNTGFQDGKYSFLAGHLNDDDEPLLQAIVREAKEEVGIDIDASNLKLIHVMHRKQLEPANERRINLFFAARRWKGETRIMEPEKCDDLRWFEMDNLPENTVAYIKQAVERFRKNITYSEYGFERNNDPFLETSKLLSKRV